MSAYTLYRKQLIKKYKVGVCFCKPIKDLAWFKIHMVRIWVKLLEDLPFKHWVSVILPSVFVLPFAPLKSLDNLQHQPLANSLKIIFNVCQKLIQ